MGLKTEKETGGGLLADIRSFVYTAVVLSLGFAFLVTLWSGGLGGVIDRAGDGLNWVIELAGSLGDHFSHIGSGVSR